MLSKKIFIVFLMFLGFSFSAQAVIISQIYFTDFSIEKTSFTAGEEIKGNFTLWNYEKEVVPDITYSYKLLAQDSSGFYTIVLDEKFSGDNFSLKPDQKVVKSFSYRLPQNLPSGNHKFRIQLFNSKGLPMSRKDSNITVQSDNRFLTLENHSLLKNGEKFSPMGTAIYDVGQTPKIIFDILNKSSFQISASPRIVFYYYNITETPLRTIEKETITLSPGGSQNKIFDLIDFQEPGNYICRLTMYQNNETISNSIDFRWKISGKEAEVVQVRVDETSYEEGEEATVTTDVALKEEGGELQVTIYDKDDKIVGEKKEEIALKGGQTEVKVPIIGDVANPKVEIAVVDKDQKILDRYEAQVKDDEIVEEEIPRERKGAYLMMGVLIVILVFMVYVWRKSFSAPKAIFMIFLVFGGIFLSANPALALEEISSGPNNDTGIAWSAPLPGYLYEEGGYVPYIGHVQTISEDPLGNNNFEFFVAELNGITTTTDADNVEVIDEGNSEVISLGELSLSDEAVFVEYDKPVQLPSDLPDDYLGEAWLCVQFKGENAITGDWHWMIACQEVIIQPEGEGCLYLTLQPGETEAGIGDEITLTVETDSKCPCIRFDTDVILIIDISNSMNQGSPKKISQAISAAVTFVDEMDPDDAQLALVTYQDDSWRNATLTTDYEDVKNQINGLSAGGNTCVSCGINTANQEMSSERSRTEAVPYHVLMTDGAANRRILACTPTGCTGGGGGSAYTDAVNQATLSAAAGIIIYTIGFDVGGGAAENLMEDIADITGGQYFAAATGEDLENIYKTIAGLLIGRSPGTTLEINIPGDFVLTDYDNSRCSYDGTTLTCEIGNLDCGGTIMDPFEFTLELISGDPDEEIEVKATLSNDAVKQKEKTAVVKVTAPDLPTDLGVDWEHCAFAFEELSVPMFRWETTNPHTGYNIEIHGATPGILDEEVDLFVSSTDSGYTFNITQIDWIRDNLFWGETYDWRVRVRENGQWSNWSWGEVVMPAHAYPRPDFSHSPEEPPAGDVVTFTDSSKCYSSPGNTEYDCKVGASIEYAWDFDYVAPTFDVDSTTKGDATTTFSESRNYTVGLKIADNTLSNGYFGNNYCIGTGDTAVTLPLPDYKEVPPVI